MQAFDVSIAGTLSKMLIKLSSCRCFERHDAHVEPLYNGLLDIETMVKIYSSCRVHIHHQSWWRHCNDPEGILMGFQRHAYTQYVDLLTVCLGKVSDTPLVYHITEMYPEFSWRIWDYRDTSDICHRPITSFGGNGNFIIPKFINHTSHMTLP